jgi:hypothetical protein
LSPKTGCRGSLASDNFECVTFLQKSLAAARGRLCQDEPPVEHPERLSYLLKLLQQELRAGK